jgi:uncharacterized coiled-coil protein SlyX
MYFLRLVPKIPAKALFLRRRFESYPFIQQRMSIEIDFGKYSKFPQEQVTKWFYHVGQALRQDFKNHGNKFVAYRVTNDIANAFPDIGNKQALKRGEKAGKFLEEGRNLEDTGYGYVLGADLARTIAYFFIHYPLRDWSNLKATVSDFGPEWKELTQIEPAPEEGQIERYYKEVGKIDLHGGNVASDLRRIAAMIEPLEAKVQTLTKQVATQNLTIVKQSNENTKLTQAIERMRKLLAELSDRIDAEKDQDKKAIMIKTYHEYLKKFENEL